MSAKTLEELRAAYPGRVTLRADEVAMVLRGSNTRGVIERIRNNMKDGIYGEGVKKVDGLWQLPLTDLADFIDPPPAKRKVTVEVVPVPEGRKRRKGVRGALTFIRQAGFWAQVLGALSPQDAQELQKEADALRNQLLADWQRSKSEALRRRFHDAFGDFGKETDPDAL